MPGRSTLHLAAVREDEKSTAIEAIFAPMRRAIESKKNELAEAEAERQDLVAEDAKLVAEINENRRVASLPEPKVEAFATADEWHAAARKWHADRASIDEAFGPLERDRNELATRRIPTVQVRIRSLHTEVKRLEVELAWTEHKVALRHANEIEIRARRLESEIATAGAG